MIRIARFLVAGLLLSPAAAAAQSAPTAASPLVVQRVHTPFVVAADYKVTDVDGDLGQLAGGYVGRLIDDTLLIGGAGYWLVDGSGGERFGYGGVLLGWVMPEWAGIRFGARGLVGGGTGTLARDLTVLRGTRDTTIRFGRTGSLAPAPTAFRVFVTDDFFVFEPQASAAATLFPHVALSVGGGYRLTGFTDALEGRLNGATGAVALQFEW